MNNLDAGFEYHQAMTDGYGNLIVNYYSQQNCAGTVKNRFVFQNAEYNKLLSAQCGQGTWTKEDGSQETFASQLPDFQQCTGGGGCVSCMQEKIKESCTEGVLQKKLDELGASELISSISHEVCDACAPAIAETLKEGPCEECFNIDKLAGEALESECGNETGGTIKDTFSLIPLLALLLSQACTSL